MLSSRDLVRPVTLKAAGPGERIAVGLLLVLVIVVICGPLLSPYSAIVPSGEPYLPPLSAGHPLGTDNLGLDVATRVLDGMRTSVYAAVVVTLFAAVAGLVIGTLAGFAGGFLDTALMRFTDLFLALPATIVAMAIAAGLGPSLTSSMIAIGVVWWPLYARLVRGEVRRVTTGLHVEAARMSGTKGLRLVRRHVVPSVLPTVAVTASQDIGAVILTIASLSFVGLGAPAPAPELGLMASAGMQYVVNAWWIPVVPGLAVGLLSLLCTYSGDGLRSVLRAKGA
ncbi:ABC transporter permease [Actinoplanes derwentensis]|uniref:Peptide/nickel transport system permease protein n=1 Tax=Actinoplanes derwentensis TaxID=113562 RepID=A0A1H1URW2_9ACTN|nr:ABC transporter permease [Actinoplanes derwentensis]GID88143.1 cytochrome c550 [Actinoplanes derwentensis]SDS74991.1 peptide/nickel transport system permease protein [Actinoplanes derwentensis]